MGNKHELLVVFVLFLVILNGSVLRYMSTAIIKQDGVCMADADCANVQTPKFSERQESLR